MRKILLSLITIVTIGAGAFGASRAFFSDSETSTNNVLSAGAIDLLIDNTSYYNGKDNPLTSWTLKDLTETEHFFDFLDLKPGDYGEDTISIHVEDNPAWACMNVSLTKNDDNTCTEPEQADDPECLEPNDNLLDGDLAQNINFVFWGDDGDNVLEDDETDLVFKEGDALTLLNGETWRISDSTGNIWEEEIAPIPGLTTKYIGKAWCFGTLTPVQLEQDHVGNVRKPSLDNNGDTVVNSLDGGFICSGESLDNAAQSDVMTADVSFTAIQARHNLEFTCGDDGLPCDKKADLMLVLDRSGSISDSELATLKTAAKSFIDSVAPSTDTAHVGQTSFATTGSLDHILTSNGALVKATIDALVAGGFTNLFEGLNLAVAELSGGNDRLDGESPDFIIVITDGNPNRPAPTATAKAMALAEATAAKAGGTKIFVVGVGNDVDATYLQTIASPGSYYSAADFSNLNSALHDIAQCNNRE